MDSYTIQFEGLPLVERAITYAAVKHAGQTHSFGGPYILHPMRVMNRLAQAAPIAPYLHAAGALHGTLEDTDATGAEINNLFFHLVHTVTRKKEESYTEMIARIEASTSLALILKLADLRCNIDLGVEHPLPEPRATQLSNRYQEAYERLTRELHRRGHYTPAMRRYL